MEVYILDKNNLNILSVSEPIEYEINLDEETNGVSTIVLTSFVGASKGNFLVFNGLYKQLLFVIDDVLTNENEKCVTLSCLDISNIFNRKIISKNEDTMQTNGIEQFIANTILDNFVNSDDNILNINYIDIVIHTNTLKNVATNSENGLYNLHTFITNCRQYKNIYTEFSLTHNNAQRRMKIDISRKTENTLLVDTTVKEISNYKKVYEVDPVTKVQAYIRETGDVYNLYLKTDRTTTTNKNDTDRLEGRIETISCETLDNAKEEALNVIKSNSYKHLVEFSISKKSKLIDVSELTIGKPIKIKTDNSIYDSYISAIKMNNNNFISYKTGNLRIDFSDKQRQKKQEGTVGNKLDISGGIVTGDLEIKGEIKAKNINKVYDFDYRSGNVFDIISNENIDWNVIEINCNFEATGTGKIEFKINDNTLVHSNSVTSSYYTKDLSSMDLSVETFNDVKAYATWIHYANISSFMSIKIINNKRNGYITYLTEFSQINSDGSSYVQRRQTGATRQPNNALNKLTLYSPYIAHFTGAVSIY